MVWSPWGSVTRSLDCDPRFPSPAVSHHQGALPTYMHSGCAAGLPPWGAGQQGPRQCVSVRRKASQCGGAVTPAPRPLQNTAPRALPSAPHTQAPAERLPCSCAASSSFLHVQPLSESMGLPTMFVSSVLSRGHTAGLTQAGRTILSDGPAEPALGGTRSELPQLASRPLQMPPSRSGNQTPLQQLA